MTYQPEGVEQPLVFEFEFGRLMSPERIVIERLTGMGWEEVKGFFFKKSTVVLHAFLYVMLKRSEPTLKPEQLEFCDDDLDLDLTTAEKLKYLEAIDANGADDEEQERAAEAIRAELAEVLESGDDDPKGSA